MQGLSLTECQSYCEQHARCRVIEYHSSTERCRWYHKPCIQLSSKTKHGLSSHVLDRGFGPRVMISPLPWDTLLYGGTCGNSVREEGKGEGEGEGDGDRSARCVWTPISLTAGCSSNDEGITRMGEQKFSSLEKCQNACVANIHCAAVDFSQQSGWCTFFQYVCSQPLSDENGVSSYKLDRGFKQP